ncbi:MAG: hypothetical protein JXD23_07400 [Spirochaetales bacterium]|nr:hypothetical protein [Spirochaetales bacterium]
MDRVQWVDNKGKKILLIDYSGLRAKIPDEKKTVFECIAEARRITDDAGGKMLFLSDVTGAQSDQEVVDALREFAIYTASSGKVEKECVVGVTGVQKLLVNMVNLMSKSKLVIFDTREEGMEYLTG